MATPNTGGGRKAEECSRAHRSWNVSPLANPPAGDVLCPAGNRQACMLRQRIELPVVPGATEHERVPLASSYLEAGLDEDCLPTLIAFVEIDERGLNALILPLQPIHMGM